MSERVERIVKNYPQMVMERNCLQQQIAAFKGVTEQEVIEAMNFSVPQGERVQTSNITDKTAGIGISYRERTRRINRDWLDHLATRLMALDDELTFFESAIRSLPTPLCAFMHDLAIERLTWDALEAKYHISRFTVSTYRKRAISELDTLFAAHDRAVAAYILS